MYDLSSTYTDTDIYGGSFDGTSIDDAGCFGSYDEVYYPQPEPEPVSCCGSPSYELPEPPAAPVEPSVYEAQSVIPAGQPGGPVFTETFAPEPDPWAPPPEAAMSVIPAGQPGGPAGQPGGPAVELGAAEALYPSMASIGGHPPTEPTWVDPAGTEVDPTYLSPSSMTIGGHPPLAMTWTDPAGNEVDPTYLSPSSVTVGPPQPGSVADNLATIYGVAAQNGDIMSQIGVTRIMDSMHRSALVWTL